MSRLRNGLAVGALALLILPAAASARPGQRSFDQTFPVASRLCMNVAHGFGPNRLLPSSNAVGMLCTTLSASYTSALTTFNTTVGPIKTEVINLRAQTRSTCLTQSRPKCAQARAAARVTLAELRGQVRTAASTYRTSIQTARHTFWNAIHLLPGGIGIHADTSATAIAPVVTIPISV